MPEYVYIFISTLDLYRSVKYLVGGIKRRFSSENKKI